MKINKKYSFIINIFFISVLIIWIVISLFRTVYNFSKIYTEEIDWLKLSDYEQREKIFGKKFVLLQDVKTLSNEESKILFIFDDKELMHGFNYLANYNLYPRVVDTCLYKDSSNYNFNNYNVITVLFKNENPIDLKNYNSLYQAINFRGDNFNAVILKR